MPKRTDIKSILVIGAGPIVIGQACEFDYSGTQSCKVLKSEGYKVILVNSNPATIMTDPEFSDVTYIEPVLPEIIEKIIIKERPDAILPTMGGQTALNCAMKLADNGVLDTYGVKLIGVNREAIKKAEDRELFRQSMDKIGLKYPKSIIIKNQEQIKEALDYVGLPAIIRSSFTLGGAGSGIAYNKEEFFNIAESALKISPINEIQIDESIIGWKEYEMEVIRDCKDNCIIVCSIENVDPMGVHTGDSITVAPALTLRDAEYQQMRNASIAVLREIGVSAGGANVQFAVNPKEDGSLVVIEMNPRVSRSSALASKATGYPIAKIATKLAIGYSLDEIRNDCAPIIPAAFEPVIDYIVTKIPRFEFEKFKGTNCELSTSMKSVGEVMSIGRTFNESLQKAFRSLETGLIGLDEVFPQNTDIDHIKSQLAKLLPNRLLIAADAMRHGISIEEINLITGYDLWFLQNIQQIILAEQKIKENGLPETAYEMLELKKMGFSDARLAKLSNWIPVSRTGMTSEGSGMTPDRSADPFPIIPDPSNIIQESSSNLIPEPSHVIPVRDTGIYGKNERSTTGITSEQIHEIRKKFGIKQVYKRVDTCAAEFESSTAYMYGCYEGNTMVSFQRVTLESSNKEEWIPVSSTGMTLKDPGVTRESIGITDGMECEANVSDRKKVVILGSGPNRIGQGIEFDYACVHAVSAAKEMGYETIMINCNPETVSTDYDTADRLYFAPLIAEDVLEILNKEQENGTLIGVIVQIGGQTPLKLAKVLNERGFNILGTSFDSIDLAEDRMRFKNLALQLNLKQPENSICHSTEEALINAEKVGFPLVVRPSYVLGGQSMSIRHDIDSFKEYVLEQTKIFEHGSLLLDKFLVNAVEVDVDAICDGEKVFIAAVMEHIEEAGIHSGDSTCSIPTNTLSSEIIEEIKLQTERIALTLEVKGLINIQFAVQESNVYILEVNLRASRTVPFISKVINVPIAKLATQVILGEKLSQKNKPFDHFAVKAAVFPFTRFAGVDTLLGPEMKSTGEVMGIDLSFEAALAKAHMAAGYKLPTEGAALISVKDDDKEYILPVAEMLKELGFKIYATKGTALYLNNNGIAAKAINKVREGRPHIVDMIKDGKINLVINTSKGVKSVSDSKDIRRAAILQNIAYSTTASGSKALVLAIQYIKNSKLEVTPLQEYSR
ncbi:carbamoyl-phosphate synthase large subunit [Wolbachia endosymbiont of Folsomia candida]|uniref:carbamoyl-phosphate synthase large subunit n=1 Tax=Wolbachia endosymbiont of Folsomia candida TaxID=169402 RepID=UPI000A8EABAA|nr:carbamoyl-phosphate synthase large subunit [Wolbachia endosymbiont of Folsomia candida]APR98269.1 carbamoyl-phosphate synthase large subunit [Wolbachia endosymbiont of Folsomia candida]